MILYIERIQFQFFLQIEATREKFYPSGGFLMKWNMVWSRGRERIQNANDPLGNINLGGSRCFTVIDSLTHCARYYGECSNFIHETWWKNDALYEVTSIFPGIGIIDMDVKRWLNKSVERKIHLLFWYICKLNTLNKLIEIFFLIL